MRREYTQDELTAAFDRVCNTKNWKMPINKVVKLTDKELDLVYAAVIHFTGSVPMISQRTRDTYHVTAAGYYVAIGA